ncbi:6753_t:CDS:1, partial [Racocetra persica]
PFNKWYEEATKNAENSDIWMNSKTTDDEVLSDISEQDLGDMKPVENEFFEIYDTQNQYTLEEFKEFNDMSVP